MNSKFIQNSKIPIPDIVDPDNEDIYPNIDTTAPTIMIAIDDSNINDNSISITVNATDEYSLLLQYSFNARNWNNVANVADFELKTNETIYLKAIDESGNIALSTFNYKSFVPTFDSRYILKNVYFSIDSLSDISELTVEAGTKIDNVQNYTNFIIEGKVTGTNSSDEYLFENFTVTKFNDKIDLSESNDLIKIGSYSTFSSRNIDFGSGNNSLYIGKFSTINLGNTNGLSQLKIANSNTKTTTNINITGTITGSEKTDYYSIGKYNKVRISGDINFDEGLDFCNIGAYSTVEINGSMTNINRLYVASGNSINSTKLIIDGNLKTTSNNDTILFGNYSYINIGGTIEGLDGNDQLAIGNNSTILIKDYALGDIEKITVGQNVYLTTNLYNAINGNIFDIGIYDVAVNFAGINSEKADNKLETAQIISEDSKGWLSTELDSIDYYKIEDSKTQLNITGDYLDNLKVTWYNNDGTELGSTADLSENINISNATSFSVTFNNSENKSIISYEVNLV